MLLLLLGCNAAVGREPQVVARQTALPREGGLVTQIYAMTLAHDSCWIEPSRFFTEVHTHVFPHFPDAWRGARTYEDEVERRFAAPPARLVTQNTLCRPGGGCTVEIYPPPASNPVIRYEEIDLPFRELVKRARPAGPASRTANFHTASPDPILWQPIALSIHVRELFRAANVSYHFLFDLLLPSGAQDAILFHSAPFHHV